MISWSTGRLGIDARKTKIAKIEPFDVGIDHTNRIVRVDPVLKAFRKQRRLIPVGPFDKPLHAMPPQSRGGTESPFAF